MNETGIIQLNESSFSGSSPSPSPEKKIGKDSARKQPERKCKLKNLAQQKTGMSHVLAINDYVLKHGYSEKKLREFQVIHGVIIDKDKWIRMMKVIARAVIEKNLYSNVQDVIDYCQEKLVTLNNV